MTVAPANQLWEMTGRTIPLSAPTASWPLPGWDGKLDIYIYPESDSSSFNEVKEGGRQTNQYTDFEHETPVLAVSDVCATPGSAHKLFTFKRERER
jgi:hypothetical protein